MNKTSIETADVNWNIISGCLHNCPYCYLKRMNMDMSPKFHDELIDSPVKEASPKIVMVSNTGDMFGRWVPAEWKKRVLKTVSQCPQHIFQFFTKSPSGMIGLDFPDNCWTGVSVESNNQAHRIEILKLVHSSIKFVSFEPLLYRIEIPDEALKHIDWAIIGALTEKNSHTAVDAGKAREYAGPLIGQLKRLGIPVYTKKTMGFQFPDRKFPEVYCKEQVLFPEEKRGQ